MNKVLTTLLITFLASASFGQTLDLETNIGDPQYVHWHATASLPDATPTMDATLSARVVQPATNGTLDGGHLMPFAEGYDGDEPWAAFYVPGVTLTAPFNLGGRNKVMISTMLVEYSTISSKFYWDEAAQNASMEAGPWNLNLMGSNIPGATAFMDIAGATNINGLGPRTFDTAGVSAIVIEVTSPWQTGAYAGAGQGIFHYPPYHWMAAPNDLLSNIILESTPVIIIRAVD